MAFWSEAGIEPLRQFRWYINFGGNVADLKYALKKCDKPKAKINSVQHKYLNHFFNFPGRLEWEDINITFASVTAGKSGEGTAYRLMEILKNSNYIFPTSDAKGQTISKEKFAGNSGLGKVEIIQLSVDGGEQEKWELKNPFFTSIQFGSLDYGSEEIVDVQCTIKYDAAFLVNPGVTTIG